MNTWMDYIIHSPEQPLHEIEWAWWRKEFQDQAGNVCHINCLLRTKLNMDNEIDRARILNKI